MASHPHLDDALREALGILRTTKTIFLATRRVPIVSGGQNERDSAAAAPRVEVSGPGGVVNGGAGKFLQPQQSHRQEQQPPAHQQAQLGAVQLLVAGGIAGAIGKTCTAPLARLTILFQVQGMHSEAAAFSKTSICHESLRIVNEEGFRAFWKGNLVTIIHRLPYSAVNFYAYERLKSFLTSIPCLEGHRGAPSEEFFVHFVGGGLAGMAAASATYPLDLVRTRLAAQRSTIYYRGIWHATQTICRDEGFLGLYKGMGATLLGVGPSIAISFTVYETLRSYWLSHRPNDSTLMISLACGGLSGIVSSTATFPLDLVRRRMQLEVVAGQARVYKSGLFGTLGHIMRSEGLRGLYRGILPEYYKVVPGLGIVFMSYEALKKLMSHGPLNN